MAKVKKIEFDDDGELEFVTVRMAAEEAAFIVKFTGRLSGETSEEVMTRGGPANHGLYSCLTGEVFNRLYDDGVDDWHANHF